MPTIDPNRPGYYTDGTPIQGTSGQNQQAGYPIGTNISGSAPIQDPAIAQQANTIRAASETTQPISRPGNPYNAQGGKVTHITADNKTVDSGRGAYDYYGVPTLASRTQGNEQYEFAEKLKQWEKEFEEKRKQSGFTNQMDWNKFDGFAAFNPITGERYDVPHANSNSSVQLPSSISNLHPSVTNVTRSSDGSYSWTNPNGSRGYYKG